MIQVRTAELTEGTIEYAWEGEERGSRTILVAHGGNCNCEMRFDQESLNAAGFSILVPSRPGYGRTSLGHGESAQQQADAMASLLDALGIRSVGVLGLSAGGPVALELSRRHRARVSCLVLEECVVDVWVSRWSPRYWAMRYLMHPKRQARLWEAQRREFADHPRRHLRRLARMFSTLDPDEVVADWSERDVERYGQLLARLDSGAGFVRDIDHRAEHLEEISAPTLIIHSRFDRNVPFRHALSAHRRIAGSELYEAPAKSHLVEMGAHRQEIVQKRDEFFRARMA